MFRLPAVFATLAFACVCAPPAEGANHGLAFAGPLGLRTTSDMRLRNHAQSPSKTLTMVAVPNKPAKIEATPDIKPVCADPDPDIRQEYFGAAIGDTVRVNWVAKSEDGEVLGNSAAGGLGKQFGKGRFPARLIKEEFCLGGKDVHCAIHTTVIGMLPGDNREVTIPAEECFGTHDEELVYTVTKDMLRPPVPADMPVRLGTTFKVNGGMDARVTEVDGAFVVLDANPENAGKNIVFSLTVMDVLGSQCGNGIDELDFLCDV